MKGLPECYQEETLGSYEVPCLAPVCPGPSRKDIFLLATDEAEEVMVTFGSSFFWVEPLKNQKQTMFIRWFQTWMVPMDWNIFSPIATDWKWSLCLVSPEVPVLGVPKCVLSWLPIRLCAVELGVRRSKRWKIWEWYLPGRPCVY